MTRVRTVIILCALWCLFPVSLVYSQWQQIFFLQQAGGARVIKFLDDLGHPEIGFAGEWSSLWRTSDSGKTWTKVCPTLGSPTDITFKDIFTGWFVTKSGGGEVFKTVDGGLTWTYTLKNPGMTTTSLYYHAARGRLYLSTWGNGGLYSDDEGVTWNQFLPQNSPIGLNGFAFTDDNHGIASSTESKNKPSEGLLQTSDGGLTWTLHPNQIGCWQPLAIKRTSTFMYVSEYYNQIYRSDDNGTTWSVVSQINPYSTGCMNVDECGNLYIQNDDFHNDATGVSISTDQGITWRSIGGPPNDIDTRFYIRKRDVFSCAHYGDIWVFHSSFPGRNLVLTQNLDSLISRDCLDVDTTILFSVPSVCFPGVDSLISVRCNPIGVLSLEKDEKFPRTFGGSDSIRIRYHPSGSGKDTGLLSLRLTIGDREIDTVLQIFAQAISQGRPLLLPSDSINVFTTSCISINKEIHISSSTCFLEVDSILNITSKQNTSFSIGRFEKFPRSFTLGDSINISYHPSGVGRDTCLLNLQLLIGGKKYDTVLTVFGYSAPSLTSFIPQISFADGKKNVLLESGKTIPVLLSFSQGIDRTLGLDSISFELQSSSDMLILDNIILFNGSDITFRQNGPRSWKCTLYDSSSTAFAADQVVASFIFSSYLTKDTITLLTLTSGTAFYNPLVSDKCLISEMRTGDSVVILSLDKCGDNIIRNFMQYGKLPIVSVFPNPADTRIIIHTTRDLGYIYYSLYDQLGRIIFSRDSVKCNNQASSIISVESVPSGLYDLLVEVDGVKCYQTILILH
jgi:hypothetical protein